MSFTRLCPGSWRRVAAENNLIDSCPHLARTYVRRNLTYAGPKSRKGNSFYFLGNWTFRRRSESKISFFYQEQSSSRSQIRINGVFENRWDTHCRSNDQVANSVIAGLDEFCRTDQQLSVMPIDNRSTYSFFDLVAKMSSINRIDSAIHKTEAVCGTDGGIAVNIENGAGMQLDKVEIAAETTPG